MIIIVVLILCVLALVYAFIIRKWLIEKYAMGPKLKNLDDTLTALWSKSRTILVARIYMIIPVVVAFHDIIATNFSSLDLTPLWQRYFADVPPDMRALITAAVSIGTGLLFEWLRRISPPPVDYPPKEQP